MRVKAVPEPPESLEFVTEIQGAVPLVPSDEADCCSRVLDRTAVDERDDARTWLSFLRGLGLAEENRTGFRRVRTDPDRDALAAAFVDGVYGAEEILTLLRGAEGPLAAREVFDRFDGVPTWERHRTPNWDDIWQRRVEHVLGWLVLLGRAERTGNGYRSA